MLPSLFLQASTRLGPNSRPQETESDNGIDVGTLRRCGARGQTQRQADHDVSPVARRRRQA